MAGNYKGRVNPNWAASVKWTPEMQEKKRRTMMATMLERRAKGNPRIVKLNIPKRLPKSRKEALEKGVRFFKTGKPCPHGHNLPRRVDNHACVECFRRRGNRNNQLLSKMPPVVNPVAASKQDMPYRTIVL